MEQVHSSEDLLDRMVRMSHENPVCQVLIPGKGKFTIVFQEEDRQSIAADAASDAELKQMIQASRDAYAQRKTMTTPEFLKSFSAKDFES